MIVLDDMISGRADEVESLMEEEVIVLDDIISGRADEVESLMEDEVIVLDDMVSVNVVKLTLIKEGVVTGGIKKGVNIISYDVDMVKDDIIVEVNIIGLNEIEYTAKLLGSMEESEVV